MADGANEGVVVAHRRVVETEVPEQQSDRSLAARALIERLPCSSGSDFGSRFAGHQFVGIPAYEAAGGVVVRDLFEDAGSGYITDAEQAALLMAASPKLACIQRFLHLTAMRQSDALRVRLADIDAEGIHYTTGKTGASLVVTWTPALRACVDEARALWRRFGRDYLFESHPKGQHAKRGPGPYTPSGLRALFRVARTRAGVQDVRLHDLRRKAASDTTETHATALLAHADPATTRKHYRAKPVRVEPAG